VRLSKGENLKDGFGDFVLCEFETRDNVALSDVDTVQNVRAVWNGDRWKVHFVVKETIETPDSPGGRDAHGEKHTSTTLIKTIIEECVERGAGTLIVGWPEDVRSDDLGKSANRWLHTWAFDRLCQYLTYKGEEHGIEVLKENEWNTSKTCCDCGDTADNNRIERGLYVCDSCGLVANADCNGAENIRQKITPNLAVDRSTGCLAQPAVYLHDLSHGFSLREQVVNYKLSYPNPAVRCRGIPAFSGAGGGQCSPK
jgi:IS605 OrfB family transposase